MSDERFESSGAEPDLFHNSRQWHFCLKLLISNGLSQSDDFRTRSGKNGEYGANRE